MNCDDFRKMAESFSAGELPVDTMHAAMAHLDGCGECQGVLASRDALRLRLRRAFESAPDLRPGPEFLARVQTSVRGRATAAASRASWRTPGWLVLAAATVLAVSSTAYLVYRGARVEIPAALATLAAHAAGDHRNCALHFALDEAPIPLAEAARLYDPGFARVREQVEAAPAVRAGTFQILAAHSCVYKGQRFAHVVLRRRDDVVSVLVSARDSAVDRGPSRAAACGIADGLSVACASAARYDLFVVSALDPQQTMDVARALSPVLQAHLQSL